MTLEAVPQASPVAPDFQKILRLAYYSMNTGVVCTLEGGVRPIGAKYEGNEADSQKFSMMNCGRCCADREHS
jgi:hypothetical protein